MLLQIEYMKFFYHKQSSEKSSEYKQSSEKNDIFLQLRFVALNKKYIVQILKNLSMRTIKDQLNLVIF